VATASNNANLFGDLSQVSGNADNQVEVKADKLFDMSGFDTNVAG